MMKIVLRPQDQRGVGTRANSQKPPFHLTWAFLNVRSIYGREKTLTDLMCKNRISVLALQETFERPNDPPSGLFASVYSKPSDDGRRGVMLIVHPLLEKAAQWEPGLGGTNPNILWIKVEMGGLDYFVASVYMPDNSKYKEADEVARQLFANLDIIPEGGRLPSSWVIGTSTPSKTRAEISRPSGRCLHTRGWNSCAESNPRIGLDQPPGRTSTTFSSQRT